MPAPMRERSPSSFWEPYRPSDELPWNPRRVVHLHRRAGFGANWTELRRDLEEGPGPAIDRLLAGPSSESVNEPFETIANAIGEAATASGNADRLKAWWLFRMLLSPDPLGERLTLMWHNHFATSNRKVRDLVFMRQQNERLRQYARGPFADLLTAVVKHPAMLLWLDAESNRKGRSNENLAREVMELFTLGVGNYQEADIKEAARALTGWTISERHFEFQPARHDDGEKQIFGKRGAWNGDDLLKMLVEHPMAANRLAWRLANTFFGEGVVDESAMDELADGLRANHLDIGWAVRTILKSQLFFSTANLGSHVSSPVDFVVGTAHVLEFRQEPPSSLLLAEWTSRMGQDLFYPPNVGGWHEGRAWLSSRTIVARANYASAIANGELWNPARSGPIERLLQRHGVKPDVESATTWLAQLLWGCSPATPIQETIQAASATTTDQQIATAFTLLLARPESQLT